MPAFEAKDWNDWWSNGFLGRLLGNVAGRYLGTNLTDAEREANEFSRQMAREANDFTHQENQLAMQFSADQALQQMAFQERMANSQYQRGVADMQAAGINPAIAYNQGGAVAPSGAAGSASSGAGAVVSSVSPHAGSLSDIFRLFSLRKELALLDAQREETLASAEEKRAAAGEKQVYIEWLPKKFASEIGVNVQAAANYVANIERLNAETASINLANEWNPKLWENELKNGEVNRLYTYAAIRELNAKITLLRAQVSNTEEDTRLKILQQGLVAAQAGLAVSQSKEIDAKTWRLNFENAFTELYGHKPDEPIWSAITSILGPHGEKVKEVIKNGPGFLDNLKNNFGWLTYELRGY